MLGTGVLAKGVLNHLLGPFQKYTVVVETKHFQHNGVKTDIELNLNFEFYLYFLKYFHSIIDCKITEL